MSFVSRLMSLKGEDESLDAFSKRLSISKCSVRNWMLGDHGNGIQKTFPRVDTAIRLAQQLGVTAGWLIAGEFPKFPKKACCECERIDEPQDVPDLSVPQVTCWDETEIERQKQ